MKKCLAVLLTLALLAGVCPVALAATQLATPTELRWGIYYDSWQNAWVEEPGSFSWTVTGPCLGQFELTLYKSGGQEVGITGLMGSATDGGTEIFYMNVTDFLTEWIDEDTSIEKPLESGTYYFTVQNISWDWENGGEVSGYMNSAIATSPTWTYVKPSDKLATPSKPAWSSFPEFTWEPNEAYERVDRTAAQV